MPPHRKTKSPRSYGRQATGRTIKSLSLTADVAAWAEAECEAQGIPFSSFIEKLLAAHKAESDAYDAAQKNILPMTTGGSSHLENAVAEEHDKDNNAP